MKFSFDTVKDAWAMIGVAGAIISGIIWLVLYVHDLDQTVQKVKPLINRYPQDSAMIVNKLKEVDDALFDMQMDHNEVYVLEDFVIDLQSQVEDLNYKYKRDSAFLYNHYHE